MQQELKSLLEQATPSDLIEAQKLISTLLRGHSGANPKKVRALVKRTTPSNKTPTALHASETFVAKALVKIFYEVFGWSDLRHETLISHSQFSGVYLSIANCFAKLELQNDLFYPVLLEACQIIKRKQEASPTDLTSYKVLSKLSNIQEVLYRAHPAAQYIKGYFACLRKKEGVDN